MQPPEKYSLSPYVILRSEPQYYGSYSAFNYKTVQSQPLTEKEIQALKFIQAQSATAEEISKATGIQLKNCEKFFEKLTKLGFIQVNIPPLAARTPQIQVNPEIFAPFLIPFLSAPVTVDFFITSRCNLSCVHCFADKKDQTNQDYSLEAIESVFSQLERMGVLEVRISGGEPLLHKDITQILNLLSQKRFRKVLLTNGTLLTEEIVAALKEGDITPTVSLDDCVPAENDCFRGTKGTYERTLEGLKILQENNVEYGINCCLNKKNLTRYQKITDLAAEKGAVRIAFLDLKPTGRMQNNAEWMPANKDYETLLKKLFIARAKNRKIEVSVDAFLHCYPMQESVALAKKGVVSCKAGISRLSIGSDGKVYPCNFVISDPRWVMGDLAEETLESIWFSQKWLFFRGQTKLANLHRCNNCKNLKGCIDFYCRLLPYEVSGDEMGTPSKCLQP